MVTELDGINICICDDDNYVRSAIKECVIKFSVMENIEIGIDEYDSAYKLLESKKDYDIIFLDIRFGDENIGIEIAKVMRLRGEKAIIVLITSMSSMSIEGYTIEAFRFLVKPLSEDVILHVLKACMSKLVKNRAVISIKHNSEIEIIHIKDILYIMSRSRKRVIQCEDKAIEVWHSLKSLHERLPQVQFAYPHKSYIVNLDKIDIIQSNAVKLINEEHIPIGREYKDTFLNSVYRYVGENV